MPTIDDFLAPAPAVIEPPITLLRDEGDTVDVTGNFGITLLVKIVLLFIIADILGKSICLQKSLTLSANDMYGLVALKCAIAAMASTYSM